jgi:arsenate reductase
MAAGWARALHGEQFDVHSAGIEAQGLNPYAIEVMREAGVDISQQKSQRWDNLPGVGLDLVITVCGNADENCPVLPMECRKLHVPFDDPPALARNAATEEERLQHYRRVRDEIKEFVRSLPGVLTEQF